MRFSCLISLPSSLQVHSIGLTDPAPDTIDLFLDRRIGQLINLSVHLYNPGYYSTLSVSAHLITIDPFEMHPFWTQANGGYIQSAGRLHYGHDCLAVEWRDDTHADLTVSGTIVLTWASQLSDPVPAPISLPVVMRYTWMYSPRDFTGCLTVGELMAILQAIGNPSLPVLIGAEGVLGNLERDHPIDVVWQDPEDRRRTNPSSAHHDPSYVILNSDHRRRTNPSSAHHDPSYVILNSDR